MNSALDREIKLWYWEAHTIIYLHIWDTGRKGRISTTSHRHGTGSMDGILVPSGKRYHPLAAALKILETDQEMTFIEPVVTGDVDNRPKVSSQKLVTISKARTPYFMESQSMNLNKLLGEIPDDLKEYFDFIEA